MSASSESGALLASRRERKTLDFYRSLIRASQTRRSGFLAERERWLRSVPVDGREELLFEFEMLLAGLGGHFNLQNQARQARGEPLLNRDFREDLEDARDALQQVLKLARQLLAPEDDQKRVFRKYIETQLADDRARLAVLEEELDQDTPQQSLFVLRQTFDALRTVMEHLLRLPSCNLALFTEVGNLALREIVLNRFFAPARPLEFRLEYDRIRSVPLLERLATVAPRERAPLAIAFLALFRLLHYLSYVGGSERAVPPRRGRLLLALVRSESLSLAHFLRSELADSSQAKRVRAAALRAARDLARGAERWAGEEHLPGAEGRHAALSVALTWTELCRTQVLSLAQAIGVSVEAGEDAFLSLVSPEALAGRLREELWVFAQLCKRAEVAMRDEALAVAGRELGVLQHFVSDFQDVGYPLLRYADSEAFDRFSALLGELPWPPQGPEIRRRLSEDLRLFSHVLERTFTAVSRRQPLRGSPFNRPQAEARLAAFLASQR